MSVSLSKLFDELATKFKKKYETRIEPKYSPKVRIGNWADELLLEEEKIRNFLKKKENGQLLIQKTRRTFSNLLKGVQLHLADDHLRFGQPCQVACPGLCSPRAPQGLALSGVVGPREVDSCHHLQEGSLVSASPLIEPVVRNCFRISSPNGQDMVGETLKFGKPFTLATFESPYDIPLFIESEVPHLHSTLGRSKHPLLHLSTYRNFYSLWKVVPVESQSRLDLWDTPVPANVPVIISHVASNKNLALEPEYWFNTYFGVECEVSVHTDLNIYGKETANNIWIMITNHSPDS